MFRIVLIAIVSGFIIIYLKNAKSEYTDIALVACSVLLIYLSIDYVNQTIDLLNKIVTLTGINEEHYKIIFKIVSRAYLIEFSSSTIEDMGLKSLSNKLIFIGRIIILLLSAPVIYAVFNLLNGLLL